MTFNPQAKLDAIVEEFGDLEPRERLELLLDYAEHLPPLPQRLIAERDAGKNRVHECQTPVYLWFETQDGRLQVHADVAPEAPTVKGFVAILADALRDAALPVEISLEPKLLERMGLAQVLGMTRARGLAAILRRVGNAVQRAAA